MEMAKVQAGRVIEMYEDSNSPTYLESAFSQLSPVLVDGGCIFSYPALIIPYRAASMIDRVYLQADYQRVCSMISRIL